MTVFDDENRYELNMGALMKEIFHSGTNYITQGVRGGGKTFTSVAFSWGLVNGIWPEVGKVILLTNVIFLKRIRKTPGNPKEDYTDKETPEGVYHIVTMEDMFRTLSRLMLENPKRDVLYLILLDEAQNFFNAYDARSPISSQLQKWFGTLRKFDACLWMMTPSINNVPPKGRMFNDDPTSPGYLNGIWSKAPMECAAAMRANKMFDANPRDYVKLQISHDDGIKRYLRVPISPWNKAYEELEVGEFGYDHLASADFTMGSDDFNFANLVTRISNTASLWMPDVMAQFFEEMDMGMMGGEEDPTAANNRQRALDKFLMLKEMDKMGLSERKEAQIFSMPKTSFRRLKENLYNSFRAKYLSEEEEAQIQAVSYRGKSRKKAKNLDDFANDEDGGPWTIEDEASSLVQGPEGIDEAGIYTSLNRGAHIEEKPAEILESNIVRLDGDPETTEELEV